MKWNPLNEIKSIKWNPFIKKWNVLSFFSLLIKNPSRAGEHLGLGQEKNCKLDKNGL